MGYGLNILFLPETPETVIDDVHKTITNNIPDATLRSKHGMEHKFNIPTISNDFISVLN